MGTSQTVSDLKMNTPPSQRRCTTRSNTHRNKSKVLRAATHRGLHRNILQGRRVQYADDLF